MNTHEWIDLLAANAGPAPRAVRSRRLVPAVALGALGALALALLWSWPPLALGSPDASLAMKLAYTGAVTLSAAWLAARTAVPAPRTLAPLGALAAALAAMAALAAASLAAIPASDWPCVVAGRSEWRCAVATAVLAVPAFAAAFWALAGLAPTRLRLAGAAAGLLAGGLGAAAYSLTCGETAPAFVAVWYSVAMALPAAAGALLGPRLLRW